MFPNWLGVLLIVGGVCYLVGSAVAEISMVLYLLVAGVRSAKTSEPEGPRGSA